MDSIYEFRDDRETSARIITTRTTTSLRHLSRVEALALRAASSDAGTSRVLVAGPTPMVRS